MRSEGQESFRLTLGREEDLPTVYDLMRKQFPPDEIYGLREFLQMYHNGSYKVLLYRRVSDDQLIGYATVYSMTECEIVWLDLFAVLPEFQASGYGTLLFDAVYQKYCAANFDGLLLCAERVDPIDPEQATVQQRRLAFYNKVGAHVLQTDFLLPVPSGGFPMHLLYKPAKGMTLLPRETQALLLQRMFAYCYGHISHSQQLFETVRPTIVEEHFSTR